jgi:hypothetical protein
VELKKYIKEDILPSLDEIDLVDLIFFIQLTFIGKKDDYHSNLNDLIDIHGVKLEKQHYDLLYEKIKVFLDWFFTMK